MESLGALPIDYESETVKDDLVNEGPFDLVLDCVHSPLCEWSDRVLGIWRNSVHISIVTPIVNDLDQ